MSALPAEEVPYFAHTSFKIVSDILNSFGIDDSEGYIDKDILIEVAEFFLRDIYRIDKQQRGSVSIAKWAGYWAFWIRKLKPIKMNSPPSGTSYININHEDAVNINEKVAVQFALEIIAKHRVSGSFQDIVLSSCSRVKEGYCDGADCFWSYAIKYMNFGNEFYSNYITYSMRNRTFGPHHFALLLENLIFSACVGLED